jgi:hypothetical protein
VAETFANNATGNLNAGITNVATSLVLQAGQGAGFPSSGDFRILIGTELIKVGARSGDTLSSLTRGIESTAAAAHNSGDLVTHELTAGALGTFLQSTASYGTTLPGSPVDGQEAILVDSTTNPTYQWRFRYNTGSSSAYKWECVGGVPARVSVVTDESMATSSAWVDLATVGPSFVVPRAGDYDVLFGSDCYVNTTTGQLFIGPAIAAGTPGTNIGFVASTSQQNLGWSEFRMIGLSASNEIRLRYFQSSALTAHWVARRIGVIPVRVS